MCIMISIWIVSASIVCAVKWKQSELGMLERNFENPFWRRRFVKSDIDTVKALSARCSIGDDAVALNLFSRIFFIISKTFFPPFFIPSKSPPMRCTIESTVSTPETRISVLHQIFIHLRFHLREKRANQHQHHLFFLVKSMFAPH